MKKSLKKILAFTMAAAMAAGLAACGSSASTSPSAGGSGSAPAVSDEPIKISKSGFTYPRGTYKHYSFSHGVML